MLTVVGFTYQEMLSVGHVSALHAFLPVPLFMWYLLRLAPNSIYDARSIYSIHVAAINDLPILLVAVVTSAIHFFWLVILDVAICSCKVDLGAGVTIPLIGRSTSALFIVPSFKLSFGFGCTVPCNMITVDSHI